MKTITALVALATLTACSTTAPVDLRTVLGGGLSNARVDPKGGTNSDHKGAVVSGRIEVSQQIDYLDNVEVGLRAIGSTHQIDDEDGDISIDVDSLDLGAAFVARTFYELDSGTRIYGEGFAGYRHFWAEDFEGKNEDDGGLLLGLGLGAEFLIAPGARFITGLEYAKTFTKKRGHRLDLDDFQVLVGLSVSF